MLIMEKEKESETIVTVRPIYSRTMSGDSQSTQKSRDEAGSQISGATTIQEAEAGKKRSQWHRRRGPTILKRWLGISETSKSSKKRIWLRWMLLVTMVLGIFGVIAAVIYISLVGTLISRLAPPGGHSGLDDIVSKWQEPDTNGAFKFDFPDNFSRDIVPKNCHSHNDYWRRVPLYQALSTGCTSIEADIWLTDDQDLLVGHSWDSTRRHRTLRSLYLDPLTTIFTTRNVSTASPSAKATGLFDTDPNTPTILLIDMKTDGHKTYPALLSQLQSLHDKHYLTYYDGKTLHTGPLTVIGSGKTPFDMIQQNDTNRFIFYDAPLRSVSDPLYNTTNTYYASAPLKPAMGGLWLGRFTPGQKETLNAQIKAAEGKGLKSRYWDTPAWPIGMRNGVWGELMRMGVGVLNVDDLVGATRWDWGVCVVAGFVLCGRG